MAGKMSEQERVLVNAIDAEVVRYLACGNNPYHLAQALGRVRWDLLTATNRVIRRDPGVKPKDLTVRVFEALR